MLCCNERPASFGSCLSHRRPDGSPTRPKPHAKNRSAADWQFNSRIFTLIKKAPRPIVISDRGDCRRPEAGDKLAGIRILLKRLAISRICTAIFLKQIGGAGKIVDNIKLILRRSKQKILMLRMNIDKVTRKGLSFGVFRSLF